MEFDHQPVLVEEMLTYLKINPSGCYVDGTLGRGGHSFALLSKLNEQGKIIALDRDRQAINAVQEETDDERLILVHENYINIPEVLNKLGVKKVDGMYFDLGFSSPQVDNPRRGFSYHRDGPLDMRMNRQQSLNAEEIVNSFSKAKLAKIIKEYGEENWAERIAEFIVKFREQKKIKTTTRLVEVIKKAIPASARRKGGHPARRTFQALRIAVNNELEQLKEMLSAVVSRLVSGGRVAVISFHSLEDRIVKHTFKNMALKCVCPPDFPECFCDKEQTLKIITKKPVSASENEIENNKRARSAKLRVGEKI